MWDTQALFLHLLYTKNQQQYTLIVHVMFTWDNDLHLTRRYLHSRFWDIIVFQYPCFSVPREHLDERAKQSNFYRLVDAYRTHGHKQADIDPLSVYKPSLLSELQPSNFGLNLKDRVRFRGILFTQQDEGTIEEAIHFLKDTYSGTIGTEFNCLEVIFKFVDLFTRAQN